MRILSVNINYSPVSIGGATVVCEELNESFMRREGVELLVVRLEQNYDFPEYSFRKYHSSGSTIIAINKFYEPGREYFDKHAAIEFMRIVDSFDPDIIHVHCIQHFGFVPYFPVEHLRNKVVITLHDAWWICDRQFLMKNNGVACNENISNDVVCKMCSPSPDFLENKRASRTRFLREAKLVYAPSEYLVRKYENYTGLVGKFRLLSNPVPRAVGCRERGKKNEIVFGFLGGPGHPKGFDCLLEAYRKSSSRRSKLLLVDVGKSVGVPWYGDDVASIRGVEIMDPFGRDEKWRFYNRIDVLLCPSIVNESFGMAVREAFMFRKWVVCTNVGGLAQDCRPTNSIVLDPQDNLSGKLKELFDSPERFDSAALDFPDFISADDYVDELLKDYCGEC